MSVNSFSKALDSLPVKIIPFLGDQNRQNIHRTIGKTFLKKAARIKDKKSEKYLDMLGEARAHYQASVDLNPLNIESAEGLAATTFLQEKAGGCPDDALPFFVRLHELGPNIVKNQYLIADYFYYRDMEKAFFKTIEHLAAIYPSDYGNLKNRYHSVEMRPSIRKGLEKAINQGVNKKQAYFSMGQFLKDEGNIPGAVTYYGKGMKIRPFENAEYHYLSFGRLLLTDQKFDQAFKEFDVMVRHSKTPERTLNQIYQSFKKGGLYNEFLTFSRQIESQKRVAKNLGIFIARARIELGLLELAKSRLIQVTSEHESAEAFYLLAVIAEKEKDWDDMELNIQKATVLNPLNCHYYAVFARSLHHQGKPIQAAFQQERARECNRSKRK